MSYCHCGNVASCENCGADNVTEAILAERERCAKIAEEEGDGDEARAIARRIRSGE